MILSKKFKFKHFLAFYLILALLLLFTYPQTAKADALTSLSDTMTRLKTSTLSSHDIVFTLDASTALDATETITVDFHEDDSDFTVDGAGSAIADFGFHDGTERTIVGVDGDCTGHSNVNDVAVDIDDATGVVTFEACGTFTSSASEATIDIEYGIAAGGTNRVTNPSSADTYILDIAGTVGDDGKIAVVALTDDQVVVSTTIDPYVTFTITENTVSLTKSGGGNPDYSNTGFNQGSANTLAASTNADSGYSISYNGATLTSGLNTIDAMAKAASSTDTEQFGINLKDNATPNTGAEPSGGSGAPASDYNTADEYKFVADTTTALASAAAPTVATTFTVTYIVNVSQTTEAGAYSTTLTYICTGNF